MTVAIQEDQLPDVEEVDAPDPDESQAPLDDDELEELKVPPAARYRAAWSALTRLHTAGILPTDSLDRLVFMQDGLRALAGGETTEGMLEQLEAWVKAYQANDSAGIAPGPKAAAAAGKRFDAVRRQATKTIEVES